jgi:hypothetical protein
VYFFRLRATLSSSSSSSSSPSSLNCKYIYTRTCFDLTGHRRKFSSHLWMEIKLNRRLACLRASCWILVWLALRPWLWSWHVPPKRRLTYKKATCISNTLIHLLPPAWALPGKFEDNKSYNCDGNRHNPKFSWNCARPNILLPTTSRLFEQLIFMNSHKSHWGKKLLMRKSVWISIRSQYDTSVHYYITVNFDNNMSTAAVFLDAEKAIFTAWQSGLPYQLSELKFSTSFIKLINSFLAERKFNILVEK